MRKSLLFLSLILLCSVPLFAQTVSGTVSLSNGAEPSGVLVAFEATTPSATSDSAMSDANGNYSIVLDAGIYDVSYSKDGYIGTTLSGLVVSEDTTLTAVSLTYIDTSWVEIDGNIADGFVFEKGVRYRIQSFAQIEYGTTVTFAGGARITYSEGALLNMVGDVLWQATETDSIYMVGENGGRWGGVTFSPMHNFGEVTDLPEFRYGYFENADRLFLSEYGQEFKHCTFIDSHFQGWESFNQIFNTPFTIDSSVLIGDVPIRLPAGLKVSVSNSTLEYTKALVPGDTVYGIGCGFVNDCGTIDLAHTTISGYNVGVKLKRGSWEDVSIINNEVGIQMFGSVPFNADYDIEIDHTTFVNNGIAIENGHAFETALRVNSSVFVGDGYDIKIKDSTVASRFEYNLFENWDSAFFDDGVTYGRPSLVGDTTFGENNGYPADTYLNIAGPADLDIDPESPYFLTPALHSSLLVDRADPAQNDADGSTRDIGRYSFVNRPPGVPQNVMSSVDSIAYSDTLVLSWDAASHDGYPNDSVTYTVTVTSDAGTESYTTMGTSLSLVIDRPYLQNAIHTASVMASDGLLSSDASVGATFYVKNAAPEAFDLLSPIGANTIAYAQQVTFSWEPAWDTDAVAYALTVNGEDLDTVITNLEATSVALALDWAPNTAYTWSVEAADGQGATTQSANAETEGMFTLGNLAPAAFAITAPTQGTEIQEGDVVSVAWEVAQDADAVTYTVQIQGGALDTTLVTEATSLDMDAPWMQNQEYNISVLATDGQDTTHAAPVTMVVDNIAPSPFALVAPGAGSEFGTTDSVVFTWEVAQEVESVIYTWYLALNGTIDSVNDLADTSLEYQDGFIQNGEYTWWVVATDGLDRVWSDTLHFTVENLAPGAFTLLEPSAGEVVDASQAFSFSWTEASDDDEISYTLFLQGAEVDTSLITGDTSLLFEDLTMLDDSTYTWYVLATDSQDTVQTDVQSFTVINVITGLLAQPHAPTWLMYPNPGSSQVRIQTAKNQSATIAVYDLQGRYVLGAEAPRGSAELRLDTLTAGTYRVVVYQEAGYSSQLLMVTQ